MTFQPKQCSTGEFVPFHYNFCALADNQTDACQVISTVSNWPADWDMEKQPPQTMFPVGAAFQRMSFNNTPSFSLPAYPCDPNADRQVRKMNEWMNNNNDEKIAPQTGRADLQTFLSRKHADQRVNWQRKCSQSSGPRPLSSSSSRKAKSRLTSMPHAFVCTLTPTYPHFPPNLHLSSSLDHFIIRSQNAAFCRRLGLFQRSSERFPAQIERGWICSLSVSCAVVGMIWAISRSTGDVFERQPG